MGFREKRDETITIKFEGEYEGAEIVCRRKVATELYLRIEDLTAGGKLRAAVEMFGDEVLISWNLEDEDGNAIPATKEGFAQPSPQFLGEILKAWQQAVAGVPKGSPPPSLNGSTLEAAFVETDPS